MNISSTEILIVLVVALIVLGPQRLPDAMKTAGKAYREFRKVSGTVQREINEVVNETTGMFTSTADVISGKSPTTQNSAATKPANASYRPADEIPADELSAGEKPADALPVIGTTVTASSAGALTAAGSSSDGPPGTASSPNAEPVVEAHAGADDAATVHPVDPSDEARPSAAMADEIPVTQAAEVRDSPADTADEPTA